MSDGYVTLILVIVFIASAILFPRRRSAPIDNVERGLPAELRGAEVAYAERTIRSHTRRLVARLDRAYRTPEGIQLVELKTRPRDAVYMSDVIELSVQRIALQDETGEAVSDEAWVVVQNRRTGTRRPHKVRLIETSEITAMREHYANVVQGRVVVRPAPARSPSLCGQCAHKARCATRHQDRA
ncbi:MAG: PD-(D/E)XK nuclease family protein [Burkholderiaceae bacterium]|nr:PD-(D/E)XK nuclease family protein [Burkholderiaceae bacterium]